MAADYFGWKSLKFACRNCGWRGNGADCPLGEVFAQLFEVDCPACGEHVAAVPFPTLKESRRNWKKLDAAERLSIQIIEQRQKEFEARFLKSPSRLPEIAESSFLLYSEADDSGTAEDTLIRLGEKVMWREPAVYRASPGSATWPKFFSVGMASG